MKARVVCLISGISASEQNTLIRIDGIAVAIWRAYFQIQFTAVGFTRRQTFVVVLKVAE